MKDRKKIGILINSMQNGGAEKIVKNLSEYLAKKFEVHLFTLKKNRNDLKPKNVLWHNLNFHPDNQIKFFLTIKNKAQILKNELKKKNITCSISFLNKANLLNCSTKKAGYTGKVIISQRHHLCLRGENFLQRAITTSFLKYYYPWADTVICISKGIARDLHKRFSIPLKKICVIYNPLLIRKEKRKNKKTKKTKILLLCCARLAKQKNHAMLLDALKYLPKKIKLILVGEGSEKKEILKKVVKLNLGKRVIFKGFVSDPSRFYEQASILVLSSNYEGFGNVLLEGMAHGLPIISTDCPSGPREILDPYGMHNTKPENKVIRGFCGVLVPPQRSDLMALAIRQVLSNKSMQQKLISNGYKRLHYFRIKKIFKRYEREINKR